LIEWAKIRVVAAAVEEEVAVVEAAAM